MPGSVNPQVDTYACVATVILPPRRVLVFDSVTKGLVKMPAAANAGPAACVTMESSSPAGNIAGCYLGECIVESDGSAVINPGDTLIIGGVTGRVKSQALAAGSATVYNTLGTCQNKTQVPAVAGALVKIMFSPDIATAA